MGNSWACFTPKGVTFTKKPSKRLPNSSSTKRTKKKDEKLEFDDALIHQQALSAAFLFHQHQQNGSLPLNLNRSTSVVYPSTAAPKKLPKSSSSRQRSRTDHSPIQPLQLVNKV